MEFLFGLAELEERGKTGQRQCYPIFTLCLNAGKIVATYPKKKTNYTKKRKEDASKKAAVEAAKKSKAKKHSQGACKFFTQKVTLLNVYYLQ